MPWADTVFQDWDDCVWQDWADCIWDKFAITYQDPKTRTVRQFERARIQNVEPIGGQRQLRNARIEKEVESECVWLRYLDDTRWGHTACIGEAVAWDDDNSDDTIDPEASVPIAVEGGVGPYTWAASPSGYFTLLSEETGGPTNSVSATEDACGTCTITVTDSCGKGATGYVRCTTGTWATKLEEGYACGFTGSCAFHQFACNSSASRELIVGNKKWDFPSSHAYCVYDTPCGIDDVDWDLVSGGGACSSPATYPPSCLPMDCNTNECEGLYGSELGCIYRKYIYYEWVCA